jgi:hypothetical protein
MNCTHAFVLVENAAAFTASQHEVGEAEPPSLMLGIL